MSAILSASAARVNCEFAARDQAHTRSLPSVEMAASSSDGGTFVFADIAGYTALTEAHGDADAADLAATFCGEISTIARQRGGELIKTIGDAVMVRHSDPAEAVRLGLAAAHDVMAGHGFPAVRVGMHHGPAICRGGDWFGSTVNLAARVAAVAAGGEVLVTEPVRDGAGQLEGVEFDSRGEHQIRNVPDAVPLFAALAGDRGHHGHQIDPVCRMLVAEGREAGTLRYGDAVYCFCSLDCAGQFARNPEAYTSR
jgi:adenylate cyclase